MIYDEDRIPFAVRGLIQLAICAGTLLAGYFVSGGMPDGAGFGVGLVFFLLEMGFGIILWLGNFIHYLRETRAIKKKLKERNEMYNTVVSWNSIGDSVYLRPSDNVEGFPYY